MTAKLAFDAGAAASANGDEPVAAARDASGRSTAPHDSETPKRATCPRCRRPPVVCYCADLPTLPSRTRILLLQHPRERHVAVGTARMAHLALPNSALRMATDFSADPIVRAELAAAAGGAYVLFPGPGALDVAELPPGNLRTLVVLDGSWSLAKKLLRLNPFLRDLPQVAFTPRRPSEYRIRRQPAEYCVSTIEALAEVLSALEPDAPPDAAPTSDVPSARAGEPPQPIGLAARGRWDHLLDPFRAMVARQERFIADVHAARHAHRKRARRKPARPRLGQRLADVWGRLVCVQGDANAWSRHDPARQPAEIVHWVAHRPATAETYAAVIAPRAAVGPSTSRRVGLPDERLTAGVSRADWVASWRAFARPDDVVVTWGQYHLGLARDAGLPLGEPGMGTIDLRVELTREQRQRFRDAADARAVLSAGADPRPVAAPVGAAWPDGRAGERLETLVALLAHLRASSD